MKKFLFGFIAAVCLFAASAAPAHAWGCTDSTAKRVDVGSTKPAGDTAGDGDGQYYIGTDAPNPHDYYVCEPPTPPTPPAPPPTGGNSNANSSSSSNSQSASNSQSSSSATGGSSKSNSTATGGNATGGNATGGNSVSGVSNSGNSSVSNNVNATGGAGGNGGQGGSATATGGNQKQTQSVANSGNSSASASGNGVGNGVGNGNNSNDTTINEQREVASAYAPSMNATAQCFKPFSGGGQGLLFGASFGGGKIDENCARLEASRQAPSLVARCKVFITSKYAKEAHVTLDDCLPKPVVVVTTPTFAAAVVAPSPQVVINVPPAQVVYIPAPVVQPAPSVVVAAAATHHRAHIPCNPVPQAKGKCVVDNSSIKQ